MMGGTVLARYVTDQTFANRSYHISAPIPMILCSEPTYFLKFHRLTQSLLLYYIVYSKML